MADIYGDFSGLSPILRAFLQFPLSTHILLKFTTWKKLDMTTEKEDGHITSLAQWQVKKKTPYKCTASIFYRNTHNHFSQNPKAIHAQLIHLLTF